MKLARVEISVNNISIKIHFLINCKSGAMAENLSILHLRTFLWVIALGSFRKTADRMNATQPAISSRIAKLEHILGARLLCRDTGKIQLTDAGEALRPHAEHMVRIADNLVEFIKGNDPANGTLKVGVTEFAVKTWLPSFLNNLSAVFPNLSISLTVDKSWELKRALVTQTLDIAFLIGPVNDERIQSIKYATHDYCWISGLDTGINPTNLYTVKELAEGFTLICDGVQSTVHRELLGHLKTLNVRQPNLMTCITYDARKELARIGAGIALVPKRLANEDFANDEIIQVMTDWTPTPIHFSGCYLDTPDKKVAERLIYFVKSLL